MSDRDRINAVVDQLIGKRVGTFYGSPRQVVEQFAEDPPKALQLFDEYQRAVEGLLPMPSFDASLALGAIGIGFAMAPLAETLPNPVCVAVTEVTAPQAEAVVVALRASMLPPPLALLVLHQAVVRLCAEMSVHREVAKANEAEGGG